MIILILLNKTDLTLLYALYFIIFIMSTFVNRHVDLTSTLTATLKTHLFLKGKFPLVRL